MIRTLLTLILFISLTATHAQSSIKGTISDVQTKEPLAFTNLILVLDTTIVSRTQSDFDGNFVFQNIRSGTYIIKASFVGYQPIAVTDIIVGSSTKFIELSMSPSSLQLNAVVITAYKQKLIDKGNTTVKQTVSRKGLRRDRKSVCRERV